jgi:hypothetical protein
MDMRYLKATEEIGLIMVYFPETTKKKVMRHRLTVKALDLAEMNQFLENMSCHDW